MFIFWFSISCSTSSFQERNLFESDISQNELQLVPDVLRARTEAHTSPQILRKVAASEKGGIVVLTYHRLDGTQLSTSLSTDLFRQQMQYLKDNNFQVLSLAQVFEAVQSGQFPDKAVAITFDDAFDSIHIAHKILTEFHFPYALFVSTKYVGSPPYLDLDSLQNLSKNPLVTIGNHSHSHAHMSSDLNRDEAEKDLRTAQTWFQENLNLKPQFLAWPYGEWSQELKDLSFELGFLLAFSQRSGAINHEMDRYNLPRFPINQSYGELRGPQKTGFELKVFSLPFPIRQIIPSSETVKIQQLKSLTFTWPQRFDRLAPGLNCFFNSHPVSVLPDYQHRRRFTIDLSELTPSIATRRSKLTCTLLGEQSSQGLPNRYYWHTFLLLDPSFSEE